MLQYKNKKPIRPKSEENLVLERRHAWWWGISLFVLLSWKTIITGYHKNSPDGWTKSKMGWCGTHMPDQKLPPSMVHTRVKNSTLPTHPFILLSPSPLPSIFSILYLHFSTSIAFFKKKKSIAHFTKRKTIAHFYY